MAVEASGIGSFPLPNLESAYTDKIKQGPWFLQATIKGSHIKSFLTGMGIHALYYTHIRYLGQHVQSSYVHVNQGIFHLHHQTQHQLRSHLLIICCVKKKNMSLIHYWLSCVPCQNLAARSKHLPSAVTTKAHNSFQLPIVEVVERPSTRKG